MAGRIPTTMAFLLQAACGLRKALVIENTDVCHFGVKHDALYFCFKLRVVVGTCGTFCATAWYRYRVVSRFPRHAISNALRRGNHRTAASFLSVSQWLPSRHRTIAWYVPKGCGSKNIAQPRGNEYHTPWYMRKISASKTWAPHLQHGNYRTTA